MQLATFHVSVSADCKPLNGCIGMLFVHLSALVDTVYVEAEEDGQFLKEVFELGIEPQYIVIVGRAQG
jgi:hypothetical protein